MSEWQPIETAPKGKRVLVVDDDGITSLAYLQNDGWTHCILQHFTECLMFDYPNVHLSEEEAKKLRLMEYQPTHWMPLPKPPTT